MTVPSIVPSTMRLAGRASLWFGAVVIVLAAASSNDPSAEAEARGLDGWSVLLLAVALGATLASRRFPGMIALVVLGLGFAWYGVGHTSGLMNVATLIAFYQLGVSDSRARKLVIAVVSVIAIVISIAFVAGDPWSEALSASGYVVIAVLFGELVRHRQLLVEQYAQRAAQAEADARHRVAEERLQIARDLHDVLAHTVSAIVVQAGVASERLDVDPEAARAALTSIRETGRQAMGEVKATVAILRADSDMEGVTPPAPRLDRVVELADVARAHGLVVNVDVQRSDRSLPELVELTAYRVVQESLTNVMRHAHASAVTVTVHEAAQCVRVEIVDDGRGTDLPVPVGFGLRGMAERVASIGGDLWHGRHEGGGWVVRATLPVGEGQP